MLYNVAYSVRPSVRIVIGILVLVVSSPLIAASAHSLIFKLAKRFWIVQERSKDATMLSQKRRASSSLLNPGPPSTVLNSKTV